MVEKICSHCGATVLVGLDYCPSCLHSVRLEAMLAKNAAAPIDRRVAAQVVKKERVERRQARWMEFVNWFSIGNSATAVLKDDPKFAYNDKSGAHAMSMSDGYTRVVCPKCLRANREPIDQVQTARLMCSYCMHQFPVSMAAEYRVGADLTCYKCGVVTFCVSGLKVYECPNCKIQVTKRRRDPEMAKLIVLGTVIAGAIFVGFCNAVATQTMPQFLLWLCVGSVFTFFGFLVMIMLGF